jgi:hypothetical protein
MGDQKSCLFCGRNVDNAFAYCPHCGYEFGDGDEPVAPAMEPAADSPTTGDGDYLVRLRTLQEVLADMERELDLILRTSSKDP